MPGGVDANNGSCSWSLLMAVTGSQARGGLECQAVGAPRCRVGKGEPGEEFSLAPCDSGEQGSLAYSCSVSNAGHSTAASLWEKPCHRHSAVGSQVIVGTSPGVSGLGKCRCLGRVYLKLKRRVNSGSVTSKTM